MPSKKKRVWKPKKINRFRLLPDEIFSLILRQLSEKDWIRLMQVDKWFNISVNGYIEKTISKEKIEYLTLFSMLAVRKKLVQLKRREKNWPKILYHLQDSPLSERTSELMAILYFGYKPHYAEFIQYCGGGKDYEVSLIIRVNYCLFYEMDHSFYVWEDGFARACSYQNKPVFEYLLHHRKKDYEETYPHERIRECKNCGKPKEKHFN